MSSPMKNPIVVTGAHRTGTTWVGKVLCIPGSISYISEPLHVNHSWGVLAAPSEHWYTYVCSENDVRYHRAFQDTIHFRFRWLPAVSHLKSWKDVLKIGRDGWRFLLSRILNKQPLLKDPFAVLSVPWFRDRFGAKTVITVRHPLGFISSLKRLGWRFNFQDFLDQPLLMGDHLEPYRDQMNTVIRQDQDIIDQGILLWKIIYSVVDKYRQQDPDLMIVRHEDLSLEPLSGFQALYENLNLDFTGKVEDQINEMTRAENPAQPPPDDEHAVQLDSQKSVTNWKNRLTSSEVDRILEGTKGEYFGFYDQEEWRAW
mgnify:CR=1 FL=1